MAESDSDSIREIRSWMKLAVTKNIWRRLNEVKLENNESVHDALKKGDLNEATRWSASCYAIEEMMNLPDILIEEEKDKNDT